jgi:hypothetical protein
LLTIGGGELPEGMLLLSLTANYLDKHLPAQVIGRVKVKPPPLTPPGPPLSARFGEAGNQALLRAATATMDNAQNLVVTSYWEGLGPLRADYNIFIHVLSLDSAKPVAQADGMPLYPTTVWEAGEIYADQRSIPLKGVPPGTYIVRLGLYTLDTGRLTLDNHQDSVQLFTLEVGANHTVTIR